MNERIMLDKRLLDAGRSVRGGFNSQQLKALGFSEGWKSAEKGWVRRLIGVEIDKDDYDRFLSLKDAHVSAESLSKAEAKKKSHGDIGTDVTYVYLLSNPANLMPFYVGKSTDPRVRLGSHLDDYKNPDRKKIIDAIKLSGLDVRMVIVDKKETPEIGAASERAWIEKYQRMGFPIVNQEVGLLQRRAAVDFHLSALIAPDATKRRVVASHFPKHHGKAWSAEDINSVCFEFLNGASVDEISVRHGRTRGSVLERLRSKSFENPDIREGLLAIGELERINHRIIES